MTKDQPSDGGHEYDLSVTDKKTEAHALWKEADELNRIFAAIHRNSKDKDSDN